MTGLNRIFLMGYLGNAPKIGVSRKGTPYTTLAIASPKKKSDDKSNGESNSKTGGVEWHQVHVWGKQSELCAKFLNKGRVVLVEGYLSQYAIEKAGKTERRTTINAVRVDWLPHDSRLRLPHANASTESSDAAVQQSVQQELSKQLTLEPQADNSTPA